jgi:hypothetical protein
VSQLESARRPGYRRELAAVLFLTLGSVVLPFIGWVAGLGFVWRSCRWTLREKLLLTLVVPGGVGGALLFTVTVMRSATAYSCTTSVSGSAITGVPSVTSFGCTQPTVSPWLGAPVSLLLVGLSVGVPVALFRRLRPRERHELSTGSSTPVITPM